MLLNLKASCSHSSSCPNQRTKKKRWKWNLWAADVGASSSPPSMPPYVEKRRRHNVVHRCLLLMLVHVIVNAQNAAPRSPMCFWCISVLLTVSQWILKKHINQPAGSLGGYNPNKNGKTKETSKWTGRNFLVANNRTKSLFFACETDSRSVCTSVVFVVKNTI